MAVGSDHFAGQSAVFVDHKSAGEAVSAFIRKLITVTVDHIGVIVDLRLRQDQRLFALREIEAFRQNTVSDIVHINEDIVVFIKLLNDFGKFLGGNKILVVRAAVFIVRECAAGIRDQHLKG